MNADFKGTPGPWNVDPKFGGDVQANGQELATFLCHTDIGANFVIAGESDISISEKLANARLAAAAPDLLSACAVAEDFVAAIDGDAALLIYDQLHAAIAKATGA